MDPQRFDALSQRLGAAGSRRQALAALAAGSFARFMPGAGVDDAEAACKGFNGKCKSNASCCGDAGLTCRKHGKKGKKRCRCKSGWLRCAGSDIGCLNGQSDPDNCGSCGHQCPAETPCCIGGTCQELCNGSCCADCFVEILLNGQPDLAHPVCCPAVGGTICGPNKKKKSDDRCCYADQECVNGQCCCDDCEGAVTCGGKCCAQAACCNGECCEQGKVCAADGESCVSTSRECGAGKPPCLSGEDCHGGVCCSGNRVCGDGQGNDVCCSAGEYCEFPGLPIAECCPINTICKGTYRGHRVRR